MRRVCLAMLILLSAVPALHAQVDALDGEIPRAMATHDVPGLAIAVIRNDTVVYARGFGVRAVGGAAGVDEHTLFAVGSTTKAFTATAVGMLVDEGRLSWDDKATLRLPGLQFGEDYLTREVTVRDLLAHRVAIAREDMTWYGNGEVDRAGLVARIPQLQPAGALRATMHYNNLLYLAAGETVAAVSGMTWDTFIARRIFTPLGMDRSNTTVRALDREENVARPHARLDGVVQSVPFRSLDAVAPAGAINSSALQMAQWLRLHLNGGALDGTRLLSDSVARELVTPQVLTSAGLGGERSIFAAYGLGWVVQTYRGEKLVWHNGGIDGMHAMVAFLPGRGDGVVVLANMSGTPLPETLALRVIDLALNADPGNWIGDLEQAAARAAAAAAERTPQRRIENTTPSLSLDRYAARYGSRLYGDVVIDHTGSSLLLRHGGAEAILEHWHFDTFRVLWRDRMRAPSMATFALDAQGRPVSLDVAGLATFRISGR
jgi:CubicO group peptidase (beta-lactamase class C family)